MVMSVHFRLTTEAAIIIGAAKLVEATLAGCGLPLIDESDSQRNVENWATCVSIFMMGVGLMLTALELTYLEDSADAVTWTTFATGLLSMLTVPVACFIDEKFPPEEIHEDEVETPEAKQVMGLGQVFPQLAKHETGPLSLDEALKVLEGLRLQHYWGSITDAHYRNEKRLCKERTIAEVQHCEPVKTQMYVKCMSPFESPTELDGPRHISSQALVNAVTKHVKNPIIAIDV